LQVTALNHNIGEIEQVHFKRIEHALSGDNNLFGPFLRGQCSDQSSNFFCSFPFGKLAESFLACPNAGVDNFEEELSGSGVEDEDGAVDGFGGEIAFECLVDGDSVDVGVVDEPNDLICE